MDCDRSEALHSQKRQKMDETPSSMSKNNNYKDYSKSTKGLTAMQLYFCICFILALFLSGSEAVQHDNGELSKLGKAEADHSVVPPMNEKEVEIQFDQVGSPLVHNESQSSSAPDEEIETSTSGNKTEDPNKESTERLKFWINAVLTNIIVILGTVGNSLTIIILTRRAMRSSTNIYLTALAVWDIVVLICTALLIGLEAIPEFNVYRNYAYAYVVSYIYPIALIAQTATIWLTVSLR